MAYLAGNSEDGAAVRIDLPESGEAILGRSSERANVVVAAGSVSGRHCSIVQTDGVWILKDLGSTNGTRVNGEVISETKIFRGDKLLLGDFALVLQGEDVPEKPDASVPRDEVKSDVEKPVAAQPVEIKIEAPAPVDVSPVEVKSGVSKPLVIQSDEVKPGASKPFVVSTGEVKPKGPKPFVVPPTLAKKAEAPALDSPVSHETEEEDLVEYIQPTAMNIEPKSITSQTVKVLPAHFRKKSAHTRKWVALIAVFGVLAIFLIVMLVKTWI